MAALDFPDTPTVGQLYGSSGTVWRWDGARWASTAGASGARGAVAYAQITTDIAGYGTAATDVFGLTATFNAVAGRTYRVTGHLYLTATAGAPISGQVRIMTGGGAQMQSTFVYLPTAMPYKAHVELISVAAATQSVTFKLTALTTSGTMSVSASTSYPAFILVEDITYEAGSSGTPGSSLTGLESQRPGGSAGSTYFATDTKRQFVHDGTGWIIMVEPQQTYVPVHNNSTAGQTIVGRYERSGGWCDYYIRFVLGAAGGIATNPVFDLPFPYADAGETEFAGATTCQLCQVVGTRRLGATIFSASTKVGLAAVAADLSYTYTSSITPSSPFGWAVGDYMVIVGRYRMSSKYS